MTGMARLVAGPDTVHWGNFDASISACMTIESGSEIEITTLTGGPAEMPSDGWAIPEALRAIHTRMSPAFPGHICTGPVAVAGAVAGDVLQVDILSIDLDWDWAFLFTRPLEGALPYEFPEPRQIHVPIERATGRIDFPFGVSLQARPFFGLMGVAPPPQWGALSTIPPRRNGGNLDNKELVAGTTLYLPVFVDGGNFSVGDGHGLQGDGEVCVTAVETALTGRFRLTTRRDFDLDWPMAETPHHLITMGFHESLDEAARIALRQMIGLLGRVAGLTPHDAYMLCSVAADLRITQVVNLNVGVHVMLSRTALPAPTTR